METQIKRRASLSHVAFDCSPAEPRRWSGVTVNRLSFCRTADQHFTSLPNEGDFKWAAAETRHLDEALFTLRVHWPSKTQTVVWIDKHVQTEDETMNKFTCKAWTSLFHTAMWTARPISGGTASCSRGTSTVVLNNVNRNASQMQTGRKPAFSAPQCQFHAGVRPFFLFVPQKNRQKSGPFQKCSEWEAFHSNHRVKTLMVVPSSLEWSWFQERSSGERTQELRWHFSPEGDADGAEVTETDCGPHTATWASLSSKDSRMVEAFCLLSARGFTIRGRKEGEHAQNISIYY